MNNVQGILNGKTNVQPSNNVQTRPSVQDNVIQRIAELRNSGIDFRRISRQLEKEGLANISKSTVANYWEQVQAQSNISAKKLRKGPALRALDKTEAKLQKQVNYIQTVAQARQRVRDLQLQKAETPEGRQDIFKDVEKLKIFIQQTLLDSETLKTFELHCEANSLPLAKTLSDAVGSFERYEDKNEDDYWPDLPTYIEEQLDKYLEEEQRRKRQEQLQNAFSESVLKFKCNSCNAAYESMIIFRYEGRVLCKCGKCFRILCVGCGGELKFDVHKDAFSCSKCHFSFKMPTVSLSYNEYVARVL